MTYTGPLPPISTSADWPDSHVIEIYDDETNEILDLAVATEIKVHIRECRSDRAVKSASLTAGEITILQTGGFVPNWTVSDLRTLCPRTYDIGCTIVVDGKTIQLLIGTLPVLDGVVR